MNIVDENIRKILVLGLSNSGKTSIVLSLKDDTNLMSFAFTKPTTGLNVESFNDQGKQISIWDFGGQERYRKEYLKDFNKYTSSAHKIIYVIDVQDFDNYYLSLQYFKEIIEELKKTKTILDFSIFLHKYDPNLTKQEKFKDLDQKIENILLSQIPEIFPPDFTYTFFYTTIYTVFEKTML